MKQRKHKSSGVAGPAGAPPPPPKKIVTTDSASAPSAGAGRPGAGSNGTARWVLMVLIPVTIAVALYGACILAAFALAFVGEYLKVTPNANASVRLDMSLLTKVNAALPLKQFRARDGVWLNYRHYPIGHMKGDVPLTTPNVLVLLHEAALDSRYMVQLARYLAGSSIAQVLTPDLRGHGSRPSTPRGDCDYIGQLSDDLEDFLAHVRAQYAGPYSARDLRVVLGGHSAGAGLVVRSAAVSANVSQSVAGYLLLAPFLKQNVPRSNRDTGLFHARVPSILGASIVRLAGVGAMLGHFPVIDFTFPPALRSLDYLTPTLTYNLANSISAHAVWERGLAVMSAKPVMVVLGQLDETCVPQDVEAVIRQHAPQAEVHIVDGVNHFGVTDVQPGVWLVLRQWFERQFSSTAM